MFEDDKGYLYTVGQIDGRQQPAIYRTKVGEPLEVLGYFKDKDAMNTFINAEKESRTILGNVEVTTPKTKTAAK